MARLIKCPKCGREGREAIWRFRAKGREYYYLLVVHPDNKKCILKRVEPPKPAPKPSEEALREELAKLKAENEELRRRLEEAEKARAEAEARAQAARYIFAASLVLDTPKLEALRALYIIKKGYTPEQREVARQVMHIIVERGLQVGQALVAFPEPQLLERLL